MGFMKHIKMTGAYMEMISNDIPAEKCAHKCDQRELIAQNEQISIAFFKFYFPLCYITFAPYVKKTCVVCTCYEASFSMGKHSSKGDSGCGRTIFHQCYRKDHERGLSSSYLNISK